MGVFVVTGGRKQLTISKAREEKSIDAKSQMEGESEGRHGNFTEIIKKKNGDIEGITAYSSKEKKKRKY